MEEHKYTIEVNFNNIEKPKKPTAKKQEDIVQEETSFLEVMNQVARNGSQLIKQGFKWQTTLIGRNTGCNDAQQKVDAVLSLTNQAIGLGTAVASGNYVGAMGMVASSVFSMATEIESTEYEKNWENIDRSLKYERAGASFNRSRM